MLTRIVQQSPNLVTFFEGLELPLTEPQMRHLINLTDGILATDTEKTLAQIQRQFVEAPDPSNMADFLRLSPWPTAVVRQQLQGFMVSIAVAIAEAKGDPKLILMAIDDSIAEKDKQTSRLETVDWHYDHLESTKKRPRYKKGMAFLVVHVLIGSVHLVFDVPISLRERTVRRVNRQRPRENRVRFKSKYRLARQVLEALKPLLPRGWATYVLCDCWYTSRRLIRYVRRQGWHLIGRLKSNRKLDGVRIDQRERALRHQRYTRVRVTATDNEQRTYLVRTLQGKLKDVPEEVRVWVSRGHHRDKRPVYLMSTDLDLEARTVFQWYRVRWWDEVDNFYLKELLGLGDFRVQSYEAIERWVLTVLLAWNYVLWRKAEGELAAWQKQQAAQEETVQAPRPLSICPADLIRQHREEHTIAWLREACQMAIELGQVEPVLKHFLRLSEVPP